MLGIRWENVKRRFITALRVVNTFSFYIVMMKELEWS